MRILGIDPGLAKTGFGIVEIVSSGKLNYVASGTIQTSDPQSANLTTRLQQIFSGIQQVVECYKPDASAIEIVFVNTNPQATLLLGQARGAALCALAQSDLSVVEYTALQMKKAIAGYGKATKAEVQQMVKYLLKLPHTLGPDASDALGLAITHTHAQLGAGVSYRGGRVSVKLGR